MLKKVLVTGGAGFIGSHIVDKLLENNYLVIVLDNLSSGSENNLQNSDKLKLYRTNIEKDDLDEIFKKGKDLAKEINENIAINDIVNLEKIRTDITWWGMHNQKGYAFSFRFVKML